MIKSSSGAGTYLFVLVGGPPCWAGAGNLDKAYASIHVGSRFRSTQDRTVFGERIYFFNPSLVQLPCLSPLNEVDSKHWGMRAMVGWEGRRRIRQQRILEIEGGGGWLSVAQARKPVQLAIGGRGGWKGRRGLPRPLG